VGSAVVPAIVVVPFAGTGVVMVISW